MGGFVFWVKGGTVTQLTELVGYSVFTACLLEKNEISGFSSSFLFFFPSSLFVGLSADRIILSLLLRKITLP